MYFALADTSWKYGRLLPSVRHRALQLMAADGDAHVWDRDSPASAPKRRRVLGALRKCLESPVPSRKPIRIQKSRPRKIRMHAPVGSVFLLPLPNQRHAAIVLVGCLVLENRSTQHSPC